MQGEGESRVMDGKEEKTKPPKTSAPGHFGGGRNNSQSRQGTTPSPHTVCAGQYSQARQDAQSILVCMGKGSPSMAAVDGDHGGKVGDEGKVATYEVMTTSLVTLTAR